MSLDIRSTFTLNSEIDCEVSYTNKICGGVKILSNGEFNNYGYEEISVRPIGAYQYLFYAIQNNINEYYGNMKIFIKGENRPVSNFPLGSRYMWNVPSGQVYNIWAGFCMNGISGIESIIGIKTYTSNADQNNLRSICSSFYGEPKVFDPSDSYSVAVQRNFIPLNITKIN